jgi:hypothetical protein
LRDGSARRASLLFLPFYSSAPQPPPPPSILKKGDELVSRFVNLLINTPPIWAVMKYFAKAAIKNTAQKRGIDWDGYARSILADADGEVCLACWCVLVLLFVVMLVGCVKTSSSAPKRRRSRPTAHTPSTCPMDTPRSWSACAPSLTPPGSNTPTII